MGEPFPQKMRGGAANDAEWNYQGEFWQEHALLGLSVPSFKVNGIPLLPKEPCDSVVPIGVRETVYPVPELLPYLCKMLVIGMEIPPSHDTPNPLPRSIDDEDPPAPVVPAYSRPRLVYRAERLFPPGIVAEEGAGVLPVRDSFP